MSENKVKELEILKEEIIKYAQSYYDGNPLISDQEFDSLYKKYLSKNGEPLDIAFGYKPVGIKTKHFIIPVGSLDKINIETFEKEFNDNDMIDITPKLDGNSSMSYYLHGKLLKAVSRGDGIEGLDITKNLIHSIPTLINNNELLGIRGEIILTWEDFEKIGGSHPRNKASGLSQSLKIDPEIVKNLLFVAYDIPTWNCLRIEMMNKLKDFGFNTPTTFYGKYSLIKEMLLSKDEFFFNEDSPLYKINNKRIPYDGLVFCKENSRQLLNEEFKGWKHYISQTIAFKFKDESAFTTIKDIEWNLSKTGRMVPLAHVENVNLDGANISKVTLNNCEWIENRKIGIGSKIEIIRANMVIPKIINVITESDNIKKPINCPKCNSLLEMDGVDLKCNNDKCPIIEETLIWNTINTFSPKGLAEATIGMFIKQFNIDSIDKLKLVIKNPETLQIINSSWGKGYGSLLLTLVNNLNNTIPTIKDILLIANISNLGRTDSSLIVKTISPEMFIDCVNNDDYSGLYELCHNYVARDGLKESTETLKRILEFFDYNLKNEVKEMEEMRSAAITGKLSLSKKKMEEVLNTIGYTLEKINKHSEFLIWDGERKSTQYKYAEKNGIEILTETEFREKFKLV